MFQAWCKVHKIIGISVSLSGLAVFNQGEKYIKHCDEDQGGGCVSLTYTSIRMEGMFHRLKHIAWEVMSVVSDMRDC